MKRTVPFLSSFVRQFTRSLPGYTGQSRGTWTPFMYGVLHAVSDDLDLWCECKAAGHHPPGTRPGERLNVDFFWYPVHANRNDDAFDSPVIVIEHENVPARLEYNLWKLVQLAAPLRVLIGYAPKVDQIESMAVGLGRRAARSRFSCPPDTEDLILLSDLKLTERFRCWRRRAGSSWGDLKERRLP